MMSWLIYIGEPPPTAVGLMVYKWKVVDEATGTRGVLVLYLRIKVDEWD